MADWSRFEVEAIVADYFHMLLQELAGQSYNKTAHRKALLPKLAGRSDQSVEMKHRNISAILVEFGSPWINGYKPLPNYQRLLFEVVGQRLREDATFEKTAVYAVEAPASLPLITEYFGLLSEPPKPSKVSAPSADKYHHREFGIKRDYLALEARNRSLGAAGEEFVMGYERHRLHELGAKHLVDRVEQVSATKGDGLGYDVLSFEPDGRERFIEVKTTAFGIEAPFYVTKRELAVSKAEAKQFRLYRLFDFRKKARMFSLAGAINERCKLDPVSYLATF